MYSIKNGSGVTLYSNMDSQGEIFCRCEDEKKALSFYENDKNYIWFLKDEYYEKKKMLPLSEKEKELISGIDGSSKRQEIISGTNYALMKESVDGVLCASIDIIFYNGAWYWDSGEEVESQTEDPFVKTYGYELPTVISEKIDKSIFRL